MRARALLSVALGLGMLAAGCGTETRLCGADCPAVADVFRVQVNEPSGACPFTPFLVPPTLELGQTQDRQSVTLQLIDPVNQLTVPVLARLSVPEAGDGAVASFSSYVQTSRQAVQGSVRLSEFDLVVGGNIYERKGRRYISGLVSTYADPGVDPGNPEASCRTNITFFGEGSAVGAAAATQ